MNTDDIRAVEIRMRCVEAVSRNPGAFAAHQGGYAAGILEASQKLAQWVEKGDEGAANLL